MMYPSKNLGKPEKAYYGVGGSYGRKLEDWNEMKQGLKIAGDQRVPEEVLLLQWLTRRRQDGLFSKWFSFNEENRTLCVNFKKREVTVIDCGELTSRICLIRWCWKGINLTP